MTDDASQSETKKHSKVSSQSQETKRKLNEEKGEAPKEKSLKRSLSSSSVSSSDSSPEHTMSHVKSAKKSEEDDVKSVPSSLKNSLVSKHGHANGVSNGDLSHAKSENRDPIMKTPAGHQIQRTELIRLVTQLLQDSGLSRAASVLEEESGFQLEDDLISQFRSGVIQGDWGKVERLLPQLRITSNESLESAHLLILQQRYLELLEHGPATIGEALKCLRSEIAPRMKNDKQKLHELSSFMLFQTANELRAAAKWDGSEGQSRHELLNRLQQLIPAAVLVPNHRLLTLIDQSLDHQIKKCQFHHSGDQMFSLLQDHTCPLTEIPRTCIGVLEGHADEVLFVSFSHRGDRIASASRDKSIIIWQLNHSLCSPKNTSKQSSERLWSEHRRLSKDMDAAPEFLAWSPDDRYLLSCGEGSDVRVWDIESGDCIATLSVHNRPVVSLAWMPDGRRFVSASVDKTVVIQDLTGEALQTWIGEIWQDMVASPDGQKILAVTSNRMICLYDVISKNFETLKFPENDSKRQREEHRITSVSLSRDAHFALINVCIPTVTVIGGHNRTFPTNKSRTEIHVWDLHTKSLVRTITGPKQNRYVIRSAMGGVGDSFIASGSEDSLVYIWHRFNGELLDRLVGHSGVVNGVSWSPSNPHLFASCSDDHTVRLWGVDCSSSSTSSPSNSSSSGKAEANGFSKSS